jgi:hypothetical protein
MSPITITESGVTFGPFDEEACFHIEQSKLFASLGEGIKTVEFLLVKPGRRGALNLLFVEAKSSVPRPTTQPEFAERFAEIRDKMLAALLVFVGARLGRHGAAADELPEQLQALDLAAAQVKFVLVIPDAPDAELAPLQDKMRTVLRPVVRAFALDPASTAVLNRSGARKAGLIA